MRFLGVVAALGLAGAGCTQGAVTFAIEEPSQNNPFLDSRQDSVSLIDEITGVSLGARVSSLGQSMIVPIGKIKTGTYDLRMTVTGGGQLLGIARTRGVTISPGTEQGVVMHLRKPLAFFGSSSVIGDKNLPAPGPLMGFDTTLPKEPGEAMQMGGGLLLPELTVDIMAAGQATASTGDGRYVLVGAGPQLLILDTRTLSVAHKHSLDGATRVTHIAISPDDKAAVVVSLEGVYLIPDLASLLDSDGKHLLHTLPAGGSTAAFAPDGTTVAVLAGPPSYGIDCSKTPTKTPIYVGNIAAPPLAPTGQSRDNVSDVGYDPSGKLLLATPCESGVHDLDGNMVLAGTGIADLLSTGGRLVGINGGPPTMIRLPFDPDDPRQRNVDVPFGQVSLAGRAPVPYILPIDRIDLPVDAGGTVIQIRVPPIQVDAYDAALSPDGTHAVFASRIRYAAKDLNYFQLIDPSSMKPYYYCLLNAVEDLYSVTEVDITSGQVGYQSTKAIDDQSCLGKCFQCFCDVFGCDPPPCPPRMGAETQCAFKDGYVPSGVSILMGAQ